MTTKNRLCRCQRLASHCDPAFHVTPDALAHRYIWIDDGELFGTAISSDDIRQMLG